MDIIEKRIDAILDERNQLRQELIMFQRFGLGLVPLLITALGGAFVASISRDFLANFPVKKAILFFFLNQMIFILGLIETLLIMNGQTHNRYIAHLERELNSLLGKPTCMWEISGDAFRPAYIVVSALMLIMLSVGFIFLTYQTFIETRNVWLLLVNVIELAIVGGALCYQFIWGDRNYDNYLVSLKKKLEEEQTNLQA